MADEIEALQREVCDLHAELPRHGLVAWTSGNLSARVPGEDLMVIKASGIPYDELTPAAMVVCDLHGTLVDGDLAPSSDAAAHGYVYRELDEIEAGTRLGGPPGLPRHPVGGIVHTHSGYATAWAARGEAIPCVLTAMADEFGGEIPIAPFARIGDDEIGRAVVETLASHRSSAVLLRSHGVFALGPNANAAVKSAVMCEDVARTVHLARALGEPIPLAPEDIDALHDRYQNVYGQR